MLELTEEIRSISEIDSVKTSIKVKTMEGGCRDGYDFPEVLEERGLTPRPPATPR